jgi:hypothetical protein
MVDGEESWEREFRWAKGGTAKRRSVRSREFSTVGQVLLQQQQQQRPVFFIFLQFIQAIKFVPTAHRHFLKDYYFPLSNAASKSALSSSASLDQLFSELNNSSAEEVNISRKKKVTTITRVIEEDDEEERRKAAREAERRREIELKVKAELEALKKVKSSNLAFKIALLISNYNNIYQAREEEAARLAKEKLELEARNKAVSKHSN